MNTLNFYFNSCLHRFRKAMFRKKLTNKNISIISNNCIAGVLYHDLKCQFKSPTINLFFPKPEDFIKYVQNMEFYNKNELIQIDSDQTYPVGKLFDIEIHFMHYSSFKEAKKCWNTRKKRINYNNIMIIMTDQSVKSQEILLEFNKIAYPKVYLTNKHLEYKWSKYISGFDNEKSLGNTIEYSKFGKRYYEQFDFIKFINSVVQD